MTHRQPMDGLSLQLQSKIEWPSSSSCNVQLCKMSILQSFCILLLLAHRKSSCPCSYTFPAGLGTLCVFFSRYCLKYSFQGTVSSIVIKCFETSEVIIKYGLTEVLTVSSGNCFSRYTSNCQSKAVWNGLYLFVGFSEALTLILSSLNHDAVCCY